MKKKIGFLLCLFWSVLLIGCSDEETGTKMDVYYVNPDGNALVREEYFRKVPDGEESVEEVLGALRKPEDGKVAQSAIPKEIEVEKFEVEEQKLKLFWSEEYLEMEKSRDVLLRAAIVRTFVQIPGVSYVSFYVDGEPLKDLSGNPVGLMCAEDFVQNTGSSLKSYQTTALKLYFSNSDGTKLSLEKRTDVHYNVNTSVEKLVVEKLMNGPSSDKRSATIPDSVKLLGVSVKEGICYVNFDSAFLSDGYNQKPEVAIYSIVNSIIANGNVTRVQILVEGSGDVVFKGTVDLSEPLEWRADFIEE